MVLQRKAGLKNWKDFKRVLQEAYIRRKSNLMNLNDTQSTEVSNMQFVQTVIQEN